LRPRYNARDIAIYVSHVIANAEKTILDVLRSEGKAFVDDAKGMTYAEGGFRDNTGVLRSSIGFYLFAKSTLIEEYFEGEPEGKVAADQAVDTIPRINGYQLIGIAGADYAAEVESRGLNVITVQSTIALVNIRTHLLRATRGL